MSKQLKSSQCLLLFIQYEQSNNNNIHIFWKKYGDLINKSIARNAKSWFKNKYRLYNLGGMKTLESQTSKGSGRPKKMINKNQGQIEIILKKKN